MAARKIDRDVTCPFLLRVFWKQSDPITIESVRHRMEDQQPDEVRIYTWLDASLGEICQLLKENLPGARRRDAEFELSFIRQNLEGGFELKQLGTISAGHAGPLDSATLASFRFIIGDSLAVTIRHKLK